MVAGRNLSSSFHRAVQFSASTGGVPVSVRPAETDPAGVIAATAFHHSGCHTCSHSRLRASCPHRHPGPGRRPLALIWPILTPECSRAAMSSSPVSNVVLVVPVDLLSETSWFVSHSPQLSPVSAEFVDRGVVESPELCSDMSTIMSQFSPLKPPGLLVYIESMDQVVIDAPVVPLDISPFADHLQTILRTMQRTCNFYWSC